MTSNMTVRVEFLIGTTIEQAIKDAKMKAEELDVAYICFDFNGVSFSIGRNANVRNVIKEWRHATEKYHICAK